MDVYVRNFIRASLFWLGTGVLLGVWMALASDALIYRPAHVHANLLGFVSMMIFGVAYHVIPRFSGAPLRSPRLALAHFWIANTGLALLVAGWLSRPWTPSIGSTALGVGAIASATGAFLFIGNIWRTLDAAAAPLPVARSVAPGGGAR
ncbi:MAG TPA: cbb3-type cytochrome c oxidase subunit I [Longimicrobiales bacterium]|nr:cbb3-type cytochrome c oxidase subunit I [Longimicrobiales bacterium]